WVETLAVVADGQRQRVGLGQPEGNGNGRGAGVGLDVPERLFQNAVYDEPNGLRNAAGRFAPDPAGVPGFQRPGRAPPGPVPGPHGVVNLHLNRHHVFVTGYHRFDRGQQPRPDDGRMQFVADLANVHRAHVVDVVPNLFEELVGPLPIHLVHLLGGRQLVPRPQQAILRAAVETLGDFAAHVPVQPG